MVINVNNTFNIDNFNGTLNNTVNAVDASSASDNLKEDMKTLADILGQAAGAKAIDGTAAQKVQGYYESLGREIAETPPDTHTVKTLGERIKGILATAADFAEPAAKIVAAIISQVAG